MFSMVSTGDISKIQETDNPHQNSKHVVKVAIKLPIGVVNLFHVIHFTIVLNRLDFPRLFQYRLEEKKRNQSP